ncbi:hypothetical protein SAMN05428995_101635 [Loktanella sp. DSM 29012]|uniref:Lipoprotein n=1 Tax=Loktanella gaetbuli TaxID=2881335 RepID=A0ABS8BX59_9RHOB|nr:MULTISPECIES: hypothetical protein [Loktanella]MCB5200308.1 hypothetical protein [Loktanella gaetbuli]SEP73157.1 hypothetical protein SAMN05428995_101635 [Loktanella sp. DSM 29012]
MVLRGISLIALSVLVACGPPAPLTIQQIEARCADQAASAAGPTGQVAIGVSSSRGVQTGIAIGVTDDFLRGRDPATVYAECYTRLSGAAPLTPYSAR